MGSVLHRIGTPRPAGGRQPGLPPKAVLQKKLRAAADLARQQLENEPAPMEGESGENQN